MDEKEKDYWFPVKKNGYGWEMPICRQGWFAIFAFMALTIAGRYVLRGQTVAFIITYYIVITVGFLLIVYCKGEKRAKTTDE